jgi:two-component system, cell cycle sensor histidine kinase and response regulator CckA
MLGSELVEPSAEHIVLFAYSKVRESEVRETLRSANASGVNVKLQGDDISQDLVEYVRLPSVVVAVLAENETAATRALRAGADEAMVLAGTAALDAPILVALIDRARAHAAGRLQREASSERVVHADRLRALGTVVAGVAHEVNNPLAAMMLSLEQLRFNIDPVLRALKPFFALANASRPAAADEIADIARAMTTGAPEGENEQIFEELTASVDTIAEVVRDLAVFSRAQDSERQELIHLPKFLDQVFRIVGRDLRQLARIEREFIGDGLVVAAPRARLVQVFSNILINAGQALKKRERDRHCLRITCRSDDASVVVSFSDTGPGINSADIERIFDAFYTTKDEGTGLGLSISRALVRGLGGELLVESVFGEGANFICILPKATPEDFARLKPSMKAERILRTTQQRVSLLLIDPDSGILRSLPRVLRENYDIVTAGDAEEAIDLLESGSTPSAILSELDLPDVSGPELWQWLSDHRPELCSRTMFFTSPAVVAEYLAFASLLPHPVLEKPVNRDTITKALERITGKR